MTITFEPYVEPHICGATRGPRGTVKCERPPDHDEEHMGRGKLGRWFTWR